MITFIPTIKDTKTQVCTREMWVEMVTSPQTAEYISRYRKTKNIGCKQRLPAVNFHGYDPKVLQGLPGSRKQADLVPTGLFMLDVDHVANPKDLWELLKKKFPEEELYSRLALVHITPSGEGLRIVMKGSANGYIISDQADLAKILGVEHDACTKDLSRWSFIPTDKDILFINPQILFADAEETSYNQTSQAYSQRMETTPHSVVRKRSEQATESDHADDNDAMGRRLQSSTDSEANDDLPLGGTEGVEVGVRFPTTFRGFPYSRIVERLIQYKGGQPEVGERHGTIIYLANNLKTICDQNVDWLMEIIPDFDKPRHEKREAIIWAVQHRSADQSVALKKVLEELRNGDDWMDDLERESYLDEVEKRRKDALAEMPRFPQKLPRLIEHLTSNVMTFQKPALAQLVFPALATHVAESKFVLKENKPIELALMGVVVGSQSVGKGGIDDPIKIIMADIQKQDDLAREEWTQWAEQKEQKGDNERSKDKPKKPIRIFESDATPAAVLENLHYAQHFGYAKDLCCFTKVDEIEELYKMSPYAGKSGVFQLVKKTYDRGRAGANRVSSNAVNVSTIMRWNWIAACTPSKCKSFFKTVLTDGTLSRVDFSVMIPSDEERDEEFIYGNYDAAWRNKLEPYLQNLRDFRCPRDNYGDYVPFRLQRIIDLEEDMNFYIKEYSKKMPDDTWRSYAWRCKLNALKKILVLYIANNGEWEDCFENFAWWSFHYNMWVKMNLFYQQAAEAFGNDEIISEVSIKSPLDCLNENFTRQEFYDVIKQSGLKSEGSVVLCHYISRGKVLKHSRNEFSKIV